MRKLFLASAAVGCIVSASSALGGTATFDATATTQAALSVVCNNNLRFGTLGVEPNNTVTTITVAASNGATAVSSSTANVIAAGNSGVADCTVTNEVGGNATASLSAAVGTFSGTTLSGTTLVSGVNTLSANITLSKATAITNETLYIGGTLTIPANHTNYGTYSRTVTLTVTD